LRDMTGTQNADLAWAWMTSPTGRAPDARRTPCQTGGPRPQASACCHAHHDRAGCASSIRSSCPGSVAADAGPRLRDHDHEPERAAPVPSTTGFSR
jgi:hypothetical protein